MNETGRLRGQLAEDAAHELTHQIDQVRRQRRLAPLSDDDWDDLQDVLRDGIERLLSRTVDLTVERTTPVE